MSTVLKIKYHTWVRSFLPLTHDPIRSDSDKILYPVPRDPVDPFQLWDPPSMTLYFTALKAYNNSFYACALPTFTINNCLSNYNVSNCCFLRATAQRLIPPSACRTRHYITVVVGTLYEAICVVAVWKILRTALVAWIRRIRAVVSSSSCLNEQNSKNSLMSFMMNISKYLFHTLPEIISQRNSCFVVTLFAKPLAWQNIQIHINYG
jgi:hypothetical protein